MTRRKQNRVKKVTSNVESEDEPTLPSRRRNNKRKPSSSRDSPKRHKSSEHPFDREGDIDDDRSKRTFVTRLKPPFKPPHDPKAYRVIVLQNGVRVALISELEKEEGGTVTSSELTPGVSLPSNNSDPFLFQPDPRQCRRQNQHDGHQGDCSWCKSFSHGTVMSPDQLFFRSSEPSKNDVCLCSVAACVAAGYLDDPHEFPGLAHLVEHMVFMGSEAHPCENKFISLVRENGGSFNACTQAQFSKYEFDAPAKKLDEILDIFSNFFVQPLFSLDSVTREVENIDHEFRMKKQNDIISRRELLHGTAKPDHPYRIFACGSKESLGKDCTEQDYKNLQTALVNFHRKHYISQNISIAIQGSLELDQLEKLVVGHFSKLKRNTDVIVTLSPFLRNPFDTNAFRQRIFVQPVGAIDSLYITWALPTSAWINYETKPLTYLSSVISSEVDGGLVDYLKKQKWILDLKCGSQFDSCTKYGVLFAIRMYITDEGYQCQNEIIKAIFAYIQTLKELKPCKVVYEDISSIRSSHLNNYGCNCSSEETVDKLSVALHLYPSEKLITGDKLLFQFDSKTIESVTNCLTADAANVMIFSHGGPERKFTKVEPHLKIKYDSQKIDNETIRQWTEIDEHLRNRFFNPLQKNRYKSTNFTLHHRGLEKPEIHKVRNNEHTRAVWFPLAFHFPFSCIRIALSSNQGPLTGNQIAMLQIWADMLIFELREAIGLAREAGVYSIISAYDSFLSVEVYGYDKKALQLAREILIEISKKTVLNDETFFSVCKNFTLKMCHYSLLHPMHLSLLLLRRMKSFGVETAIEAHSGLLQTSNKDFNYFIQNFMSKMKLSLWVSGNALKDDVELFANEFEEKFDCNFLKRCYNSIYSPRTVSLPINSIVYRVESLNRNHSTTAILNYYQFCPSTPVSMGLVVPLISMMEVPFFNEIRTQKTLGYSVSCGCYNDQGILGAIFYIVTDVEKHKVESVSHEIDLFMENFYNTVIKSMTENEYAKLCVRFPSLKKLKLNVDMLKEVYANLLLPGGKLYCKASVQVVGHKKKQMENIVPKSHARDYLRPIKLKPFSPKEEEDSAPGSQKVMWVKDIDQLHRQLPLFPLPNAKE